MLTMYMGITNGKSNEMRYIFQKDLTYFNFTSTRPQQYDCEYYYRRYGHGMTKHRVRKEDLYLYIM